MAPLFVPRTPTTQTIFWESCSLGEAWVSSINWRVLDGIKIDGTVITTQIAAPAVAKIILASPVLHR